MVVFALSMLLPAFRALHDGNFAPGYETAWFVETIFWKAAWESVHVVIGAASPPPAGHWDGVGPIVVGATANHLFLAAWLTASLGRYRTAGLCSVVSSLCALGCLLPDQIVRFNSGWWLGPGYFVWCAAPIILAVSSWRAVRAEMSAEGRPLVVGFFTSRTACHLPNR